MKDFGYRVRVLRRAVKPKILQADLARQAGIARTTLSQIERGEHGKMRLHTALAIAKALHTSLDYLCGRFE